MKEWLMVGLGGMAGTILRHAINTMMLACFGGNFPWGTLLANAIGCFLAGIGWQIAGHFATTGSPWETACRVGFLGGLTTFSAFSLEVIKFSQDGKLSLAAAVLFGNLIIGLILVMFGFEMARWFIGRHQSI